MFNRPKFYEKIKPLLFNGKMSQSQVDGTNAILDEYELNHKDMDIRWLAYMLATVYHECDKTMQPIEEYSKGKGKAYGIKGKYGQSQHGRGFVQLTWDSNYEKADKKLKLNGALLKNFDLAMKLPVATKILFFGMTEGWFTTRKLIGYFSSKNEDPYNARRIINGTDKAKLIEGYYHKFLSALT